MMENEGVEILEFQWGRKRGFGGKSKNVRFYDSFVYDGVEYNLYDSVYVYGNDQPEPYIGKLIKIFENSNKGKRVKILWFFRPYEISNFLGAEKVNENELFLACGEGPGVANVNPLEAIAGKCNVVCTSSDSRNLQPSDDDLQSADFFFYRFFDVERSEILIKIDNQIAGLDVKFLFNKVDSREHSFLKPDSREKGDGKESGKSKGLLAKEKPQIGEKLPSYLDKQHTIEALIDKKGSISNDAIILNSCMGQINTNVLHSSIPNDVNAQTLEVEEIVNLKPSISVGGNSTSKLHKEFDDRKDNERRKTSSCKIDFKSFENFSIEENNVGQHVDCSLVDGKLVTTNDPHESIDRPLKKAKSEVSSGMLDKESKGRVSAEAKTSEDEEEIKDVVGRDDITFQIFDEMKNDDNSQRISEDPLKPSKLDTVAMKLARLEGTNNGFFNKRKHDEKIIGLDDEDLYEINNESIKKLKSDKNDPQAIGCDHSKKLKPNEKNTKLDNAQLSKASSQEAPQKDKKTDKQGVAQTQVDKSKWFKDLPWKERLQSAHEQGTLVLLQNMAPRYTSADVEELVLQAFDESCTAKMIHQISFSSPHSGQAFVIFRNKQVAETVVRKLEECCLWLPNNMPLVARFAMPLLDRQATFVGHFNLDKHKYHYQREMREAVSTSHCSQPNTLEYDMAMEWFHLQECFDKEWKMVHEKQAEELRKTRATMKSKGS